MDKFKKHEANQTVQQVFQPENNPPKKRKRTLVESLRSSYGASSQPSDGMDAKDMNIFQFTESNVILTTKRQRKTVQIHVPLVQQKHQPSAGQNLLSPSLPKLVKNKTGQVVSNKAIETEKNLLKVTRNKNPPKQNKMYFTVRKYQTQNMNKDKESVMKPSKVSEKSKEKTYPCNPQSRGKTHHQKGGESEVNGPNGLSNAANTSKTVPNDQSSEKISNILLGRASVPRLAPIFKAVSVPVTVRHSLKGKPTSDAKVDNESTKHCQNGYTKKSSSESVHLEALLHQANKDHSLSPEKSSSLKPQTSSQNKKQPFYTIVPRFEEVSYKQFDGYVQISICPKRSRRYGSHRLDLADDDVVTKSKSLQLSASHVQYNCLTPLMLDELCAALEMAQESPCKTVLLVSAGPVFCSGFDLRYFTFHSSERNKTELLSAVDGIRKFVSCLIHFTKPIVAAVQGPAVGLGASTLCLCDVVLADENAWIQFPYPQQGLTPDGCASYLLPSLLNQSLANALLYGNRTLTASEACSAGFFSEVLPHQTFRRHVIPRVRDICASSSVSLAATKRLMRSRHLANLVCANESESRTLRQCLSSPECLRTMRQYIERHLS